MNIRFDFIGSINDDNTLALRNFIDSQAHIKPISSLTINISSLGGCVASGITIYNYLKQQPFPIATHNLGEVSSAALLLYLAGSTRTAAPVSKFMIHPIKIGISGDFPYFQVEELLKSIDMDIKNYARIVDSETNSLNKQ
jgi:ATP-dependent protease ClpP protease subunit